MVQRGAGCKATQTATALTRPLGVKRSTQPGEHWGHLIQKQVGWQPARPQVSPLGFLQGICTPSSCYPHASHMVGGPQEISATWLSEQTRCFACTQPTCKYLGRASEGFGAQVWDSFITVVFNPGFTLRLLGGGGEALEGMGAPPGTRDRNSKGLTVRDWVAGKTADAAW